MITHISPLGSMDLLSQLEVDMLKRTASSHLYQLYRNCSLAVLHSGSLTDSSKELLEKVQVLISISYVANVALSWNSSIPLKKHSLTEKLFAHYKLTCLLYCAIFCLCMDKSVQQNSNSISIWKTVSI